MGKLCPGQGIKPTHCPLSVKCQDHCDYVRSPERRTDLSSWLVHSVYIHRDWLLPPFLQLKPEIPSSPFLPAVREIQQLPLFWDTPFPFQCQAATKLFAVLSLSLKQSYQVSMYFLHFIDEVNRSLLKLSHLPWGRLLFLAKYHYWLKVHFLNLLVCDCGINFFRAVDFCWGV